MKEYVNFLTEKGLLAYEYRQEEAQTFKTTEKGLRFLETYNWIHDIINEEEQEEEEEQQAAPSLQFRIWTRREKKTQVHSDSL